MSKISKGIINNKGNYKFYLKLFKKLQVRIVVDYAGTKSA